MRIAAIPQLHPVGRPPPGTVVAIDSGGHRARVLARRDALVEAHLYLVPPIAHRLALSLPPCFDSDDLVATGNLALLHSATAYRPGLHGGCPFSAFARPRIRGAMLDSVRRRHWEESTRPPLEFEEVGTCRGGSISDRHNPMHEPRIEATIEIDADERRLRKRVVVAISWLPARQRAVIAAYYREDNPSLATVGAALGLSEWRVVREHADAIAELRRRLRGAA